MMNGQVEMTLSAVENILAIIGYRTLTEELTGNIIRGYILTKLTWITAM
jgi:hypothetical protein